MTSFNELYNALESAFQRALVAVYNANISADQRTEEIATLRAGLERAMSSEQLETFARQCEETAERLRTLPLKKAA